jgi:hydrogenase maturation protease
VSTTRVIVLGNETAGDDGAALRAVRGLSGADLVLAGRPGPTLLDLLQPDRRTVLVDVTQSGAEPGTIIRHALGDLVRLSAAQPQTSSHGFGPAEVLRLAEALGRPLPPGMFVGIEGRDFGPSTELSAPVEAKLSELRATIEALVDPNGDRHA